jgi:hypothetical protein
MSSTAPRAIRVIAALMVLGLLVPAQESQRSTGSPSDAAGERQTGKILAVEPHEEGRAFDWIRGGLALIPLYDHYPFYDITIQSGGKDYVVRYETQTGYYPAAWKPGSTIQVRRGRGRLYLFRYDGEEVAASIVRTSSHHP